MEESSAGEWPWPPVVRPIRSVLVVDDDEEDLQNCRSAAYPRHVYATKRASEALSLARSHRPDLAFVDLLLGDQPDYRGATSTKNRDAWGIDLVRDLRAEHRDMTIVMMTNTACLPYKQAAHEAGANAGMHKLVGYRKAIAIVERDMLEEKPAREHRASLDLNEYEYIAQTYIDNGRNAVQTAKDLGIERNTLYRKLRGKAPLR